jgi:hypothetical protein
MKDIIRLNQLAGTITEGQAKKMLKILNENKNSSDLIVHYYKQPDDYNEKGLADDFHKVKGKKVKYIVGYTEDDDIDDIGYIYSKSGLDIETDYNKDDLDDAFVNSLN